MNKKRYILLVISISIIASLVIEINLRHNDNFPQILGGAFTFIIAPYIISSLIKYRLKISLWNWNFDDKSFLKTYIVIWCIWVLLNAASSRS
jgi:hypothetical protein